MGSIRKAPRNASRWEARYRDLNGQQRTKTFDSKASARAWLIATEADIRRGGWVDPSRGNTKLRVVAESWLASDQRKRPGSVARDRSILDNHILPAIGGRPVGSITRADVQTIVNTWSTDYSASTAVRHFACLRAIFSYAENGEIIARTPCRSIRLPGVSGREAQILDQVDMEKLADAMAEYGPMLYLAGLGLRWGEIAGLRVRNLDFLRCTVTVARQRTRGEHGRMVEHDPKTRAGKRALSVPDWMMHMLAEALAIRKLKVTDSEELVFVSPDGAPLHYSNWRRRVWVPALEKAKFVDLTFHDLKHTAATALVEEGVDVKTAQARLGHANPQTTLGIYAQATERADKAAAKRVGRRLRPRTEAAQRKSRPKGA